MSNTTFEAATVFVLVVYLFALVWTVRRDRFVLLLVNAVTATAVAAYNLFPLRYLLTDERVTAIEAFEIVTLAAALWALSSHRVPRVASYFAFGVHLLVAVAAVVFAFAFRMTRLF